MQTTRERLNLLADTDWSLIDRAVVDGGESSVAAMEAVSRRYWPVVYGYARACGCDVHEASDITQGFLCDQVVTGRLLRGATPDRGRFRNLLRVAVRRYVVTQRRRRRGRGEPKSTLGGLREDMTSTADSTALAPEHIFDAQWAAAVVRRVLQSVRRHYMDQCQEAHWEVFVGRVVRPMLFDEPPTPYAVLIDRYDLVDGSQASNMMITVKRKFARDLRAEVGRTVRDPDDVEDELQDLLGVLQRGTVT